MHLDPEKRGQGRTEPAERGQKPHLPYPLAKIEVQGGFAEVRHLRFPGQMDLQGQERRAETGQQNNRQRATRDHLEKSRWISRKGREGRQDGMAKKRQCGKWVTVPGLLFYCSFVRVLCVSPGL